MNPSLLALGVVGVAGLYLLALGLIALLRPAAASRFLLGFAGSASVHYLELAIRVLVGLCLLLGASHMPYAAGFWTAGLVLAITSAALALMPWRLHQRFASRFVPPALRFLTLIGLCALLGGAFILACAGIGAAGLSGGR